LIKRKKQSRYKESERGEGKVTKRVEYIASDIEKETKRGGAYLCVCRHDFIINAIIGEYESRGDILLII